MKLPLCRPNYAVIIALFLFLPKRHMFPMWIFSVARYRMISVITCLCMPCDYRSLSSFSNTHKHTRTLMHKHTSVYIVHKYMATGSFSHKHTRARIHWKSTYETSHLTQVRPLNRVSLSRVRPKQIESNDRVQLKFVHSHLIITFNQIEWIAIGEWNSNYFRKNCLNHQIKHI